MNKRHNRAPNATAELVRRAQAINVPAWAIERTASTKNPHVIRINGVGMTLAQARQYIEARERRHDVNEQIKKIGDNI